MRDAAIKYPLGEGMGESGHSVGKADMGWILQVNRGDRLIAEFSELLNNWHQRRHIG